MNATVSSAPDHPSPTGGSRPFFSLCIPAYNRSRFLEPLLESIFSQGFDDFELIVAEDASGERERIRAIVRAWQARFPAQVRLHENAHNIGYDANIRQLVGLARGRFCFFMGNDDLVAPGAFTKARAALERHPGSGMLLRGYEWFQSDPAHPADAVRYVRKETLLPAGEPALTMCYRRSGVISGYIIERELAHAAATDRFDGCLYYQMHLTASVLAERSAVVIPDILVFCRDTEAPEFGAADTEKGHFTPGKYTPEARVAMISGSLRILEWHARERLGKRVLRRIQADYAKHFYPYVRDQLSLPLGAYLRMCRQFAATGLWRFPALYANFVLPYLLGKDRSDRLLKKLRSAIGRTASPV